MKRLIFILTLILCILSICSLPVFAVVEGEMYRPMYNFDINQTYLYGEKKSDGTNAHKGVDYSTGGVEGYNVYPSYTGTVSAADWSSAEGWYVLLNHGNNIYSYYCHLKYDPKSNPGISVGQTVYTSTVIGKTGNTGSTSQGAHLHFSVRQGGSTLAYARNPEKWFSGFSYTGKIKGSAWNNQVDPTSTSYIKITGAQKTLTSYGSSYTYARSLFSFGDSEDWFIGDVTTSSLSNKNYTLTTANLGNSKNMYMEVGNGYLTTGDFDVGNTINDVYEFNESFSTAKSATIGTTYNAYIFNSRDDDYYSFIPSSSGTITINLTNLPDDFDLELYNSSYTRLTYSNNGGTSNEVITYSVTGGQKYYVRVLGWNGKFNIYSPYQLRMTM